MNFKISTGVVLCFFVFIFAFFSKDSLPVWRWEPFHILTLADARGELQNSNGDFPFAFEMNEQVLDELNHLITDAPARAAYFQALHRMRKFSPQVKEILLRKNVPVALALLPLLSSGYRPDFRDGDLGVGLWHVTEFTANIYGIIVGEGEDQRTDIQKSTEGMADYLLTLNSIFHDWGLCILAYHEGEGTIRERIATSGVRDPWIIERGAKERRSRLSRFTAYFIAQKVPSLIGATD